MVFFYSSIDKFINCLSYPTVLKSKNTLDKSISINFDINLFYTMTFLHFFSPNDTSTIILPTKISRLSFIAISFCLGFFAKSTPLHFVELLLIFIISKQPNPSLPPPVIMLEFFNIPSLVLQDQLTLIRRLYFYLCN